LAAVTSAWVIGLILEVASVTASCTGRSVRFCLEMNTTPTDVVDLYDFAVPHRLGRDATAGLRRLHETMARDFEHTLGALSGSEVRGTVVSIEQMRYERFVDRHPGRAFHAVLDSRGFDCGVDFLLPAPTARCVVGNILNTDGGPERPITMVDAHLVEAILPDLVEAADSAICFHHESGLRVNRFELNGKAVKLVTPNDIVIVVELQFSVDEDTLVFIICYPQEPVMPLLASLSDMEREATTAAMKASPIGDCVQRVAIPISIRLPAAKIQAEALNSLSVGDILQTGVRVDSAPLLVINDRPALKVRTTPRGSRLACAVTGPADHRDTEMELR